MVGCVPKSEGTTCGKSHVSLSGTDGFGDWVTSPYKQYPANFSRFICRATLSAWTRLGVNLLTDWEDAGSHPATSFYVPLDPYCNEQVLGAYGADLAWSKTSKVGRQHVSDRLLVALKTRPCPLVTTNCAKGSDFSCLVAASSVPPRAYDFPLLTDEQRERIADNAALAKLRRISKRTPGVHVDSGRASATHDAPAYAGSTHASDAAAEVSADLLRAKLVAYLERIDAARDNTLRSDSVLRTRRATILGRGNLYILFPDIRRPTQGSWILNASCIKTFKMALLPTFLSVPCHNTAAIIVPRLLAVLHTSLLHSVLEPCSRPAASRQR